MSEPYSPSQTRAERAIVCPGNGMQTFTSIWQHHCQFAGQFESAEEAYEKAIALQPHMFRAHSALSTVRRQTPASNHIERLEKLRERIATPRDQLHLGHAMAKEQEDLELWQESLASLAWAKRAQAEQVAYQRRCRC